MQVYPIKIPVFVLLLLLASCFSVKDVGSLNMASIYRTSEQYFHPEFVAYNENDSTVRLFVKVLPGEFLFVRQSDEKFRAILRIHSDIIGSYELTNILDSVSSEFDMELSEKSDTKLLSMTIPLKISGKYLIHCTLTDKNKSLSEDYFIQLDRLSKPSRQDFLVTDNSGNPIFRNYLYSTDTVKITYKDSLENNFWCKFYHRDFPLAAPPFSFDIHEEFDYRPDSLFQLTKSNFASITQAREGFYHFQLDTVGKTGLTLFRFNGGFPDITSPRQMIEAVRYLTSKKEFDEMKNAPSPKPMLDNFWLTHGGNEEKSRGLIRKYYGRIRDANKYFTSYVEGWRTDRGMIYTIFGSPGTIYRGEDSESWIYGTPNSSLALSFFFIKVNNPFTENDFTLTRSPSYESNWYRAVEIWRQGRAYNSFY